MLMNASGALSRPSTDNDSRHRELINRPRLPRQHHSAEGTVFDQMAESFGGLVELVRSFDDRLYASRGQQRQNCGPCGRFDGMRLREQGEAAHAGAFPDYVGDIDRRVPSRRISEGSQHTMDRKGGERLTRQGTADAVDDNVHAAAPRDAGDAISETLS